MFYLLLSFVFACSVSYAQEGIHLSPSPQLTALGGTGTAVITDDAFAFFYNPAQLGQWSKDNNLATHFYTDAVDLYPVYVSGWKFNNTSVVAGYNFRNILPKLDISFGVGYLYNHYDYGVYTSEYSPDGIQGVYDYYKSYSVGVGFHSLVDFSLGLSYKNLYTRNSDNAADQKKISAEELTGVLDYGAFLNIPVHTLLMNSESFSFGNQFSPFLNMSIGCAWQNVKKESAKRGLESNYYQSGTREARLGYSFDLGTDFKINDQSLRPIEVKWITEAIAFLNSSVSPTGDVVYQGGFGDMDLGVNLIQRKGYQSVVRLSGFSVEFARVITINSGSRATQWDLFSTSGYSLRLQGVLELINAFYPVPALKNIAQHFDFKYDKGIFYKGIKDLETTMEGIQLTVKGYSF